jgi:hypothetical protein
MGVFVGRVHEFEDRETGLASRDVGIFQLRQDFFVIYNWQFICIAVQQS